MRFSRRRALALALGTLLVPRQRAHAASTVIEEIPLEVAENLRLDRPFVVALYGPDPRVMVRSLRARYPDLVASADSVRFRVATYRPFLAEGRAAFAVPTFVVDYDEPAFRALEEEVGVRCGSKPSPSSLSAFVFERIRVKSRARSFDVASVVARRAEGDCTEHAVLLAAFLRRYRTAARVVFGIYFEAGGERPLALGHAWTEAWIDHRWIPFDATRPSEMVGHRHLPLFVMRDESVGFLASLVADTQRIFPARLRLESGVESAATSR